jgi:hypothetical protein
LVKDKKLKIVESQEIDVYTSLLSTLFSYGVTDLQTQVLTFYNLLFSDNPDSSTSSSLGPDLFIKSSQSLLSVISKSSSS